MREILENNYVVTVAYSEVCEAYNEVLEAW